MIPELQERFTRNYLGDTPYISRFAYADSWKDATQCLQLCDLLNGCVYQALNPAKSEEKRATREAMEAALLPLGIKHLAPSFWRGFAPGSLRAHFPKFAVWCWQPDAGLNRERRRMVGSTTN